jgi:hypothetical protein
MESNDRVGIEIRQPVTIDERLGVAQKCSATLEISFPVLVDPVGDPVGKAYSAMPDRLYLVDRDGRIAYKSGRGPFGFHPGELEQALIALLLCEGAEAPVESVAPAAVEGSRD